MSKKKPKDLQIAAPNPVDFWIPKGLQDKTLGDLLTDPDVEFRGGKGALIMKRSVGGDRVTIRVDRHGHFGEISSTVVDGKLSRDDRDKMIRVMRDEHGMTQQEIADRTGLSQSNISCILRRQK